MPHAVLPQRVVRQWLSLPARGRLCANCTNRCAAGTVRQVMPVLAPSPALRPTQLSLEALPPLALYVHIPWCVRKCPYCDFNSHEARGELPEARYVAALTADLEVALPLTWGRRVHSVFFGGGTPSLLSARALDDILSHDSRALAAVTGCRDHTGGQSWDFRGAEVRRFPGARHQPAFHRHPELRSAASAGARAHPRRAGSTPCGRDRAGEFRQLQPRSHVCVAGADLGAGRSGYPQCRCAAPRRTCRPIT